MDDVQIINLYFARDENAIAETKNKYENMCYSVAHNILYNREDSEECVNDTWFFTWNSIPPKRPSILASFVSKITRNTAIDRYRKKNAQKRTDSHMEDIAGEVEK
ncbi:MAG: RNA polymerase sigma factor [Ruminococcus sp.]